MNHLKLLLLIFGLIAGCIAQFNTEFSCKVFSEDKNSCVECNDGFFKSLAEGKNYGCYPCSTGCELCTSYVCSKCALGFFSYNDLCYKCSDSQRGCAECTKYGVCEKCQNGYDIVDGKCSLISKLECSVSSCASCVAEGDSCLECQKGFYKVLNIVDETYSCGKCMQGCSVCYNKNECSQCNEGLGLNEKGECVEIVHNPGRYFKLNDNDFYKLMAVIFIVFFALVCMFFLVLIFKRQRSKEYFSDKYILMGDPKKAATVEDEETKDSLS